MPEQKRGGIVSGVGKDSRRTDKLNATPGLTNSSLQQGDVQKFERGQQTIQTTQGQQQPSAAAPPASGAPIPNQDTPLGVPDPVDFAISRVGGKRIAPPTEQLTQLDTNQWLPLVSALARSNSASGRLKQSFINMFAQAQTQPYVSTAVVVDGREAEAKVLAAFN